MIGSALRFASMYSVVCPVQSRQSVNVIIEIFNVEYIT